MKSLLLLGHLAQLVSAPTPLSPEQVVQGEIPRECKPTEGEIVVCAKRDNDKDHRLKRLSGPPDPIGPPRAEIDVGKVKVGLRVEAGSVGGFSSPRIMVGITVPLGRKN